MIFFIHKRLGVCNFLKIIYLLFLFTLFYFCNFNLCKKIITVWCLDVCSISQVRKSPKGESVHLDVAFSVGEKFRHLFKWLLQSQLNDDSGQDVLPQCSCVQGRKKTQKQTSRRRKLKLKKTLYCSQGKHYKKLHWEIITKHLERHTGNHGHDWGRSWQQAQEDGH